MSIQLWDWQNSTGEIEGTFPIVPTKPNTTGMLPETSLSDTKESANGEAEGNQEVSEPENPINWRGITHTRNIRAVLFHPSGDYIFAVAPDSPKQAVEELAHCRYVSLFCLVHVRHCVRLSGKERRLAVLSFVLLIFFFIIFPLLYKALRM